jgi:hypothetical protein
MAPWGLWDIPMRVSGISDAMTMDFVLDCKWRFFMYRMHSWMDEWRFGKTLTFKIASHKNSIDTYVLSFRWLSKLRRCRNKAEFETLFSQK